MPLFMKVGVDKEYSCWGEKGIAACLRLDKTTRYDWCVFLQFFDTFLSTYITRLYLLLISPDKTSHHGWDASFYLLLE